MFRLNYLVRAPISFVGDPWRATADLVGGRVATVTMLHRSTYDRPMILSILCQILEKEK